MSEEGWASEATEEVVEEVAAPKAEKKNEEQAHAHKVAAAKADAPMLELAMPVGSRMDLDGIPMEVVKVDGMTVTFKRKDIVA